MLTVLLVNKFFQLVQEYPRAYMACCVAAGSIIRWHLAGGDFARFMNPLFMPPFN
jgi:hypothetical protein